MDEALGLAHREGLAIRVILNAGNRRDRDDPESKASQVTLRELDPEPWTLTSYDSATGAHVLARGMARPSFIDKFTLPALIEADEVRRCEQAGLVYVRDPRVRSAALSRAAGCCEYCGVLGFMRADGAIYVETHHVIPLHEGGPDTVANIISPVPQSPSRGTFRSQCRPVTGGLPDPRFRHVGVSTDRASSLNHLRGVGAGCDQCWWGAS